MRRSRAWIALLLALGGCGPTTPSHPESAKSPERPRTVVGTLKDGQSGRVGASGFFRDESGVLWVDAEATVVPSGEVDGLDPRIEDTAWIARVGDAYHLGLDLTAPRHVEGRPSPRAARWIEARDLAAMVARIRETEPRRPVRR
jgi:hypothetical protein